jgi:hypothetical protein
MYARAYILYTDKRSPIDRYTEAAMDYVIQAIAALCSLKAFERDE